MTNSRPLQFIDYACGHSTPVRGSNGAKVTRVCPACFQHPVHKAWAWFIPEPSPERMLGHTITTNQGESQ